MRSKLRAILALVLSLPWTTSIGQRIWDNPFESTLRTHQNKAWTLSAGTAMMMGVPSTLQTDRVLNHGSTEAPVLDTLHQGVWTTEPQLGWRVGAGHLWLREEPLWADRWSVSFHLSQVRQQERYIGNVKGVGADTSVAFTESPILTQASAWALDLDVQSARGLSTGPEGFLEVRAGMRGAFHLGQSGTPVLPMFFAPMRLPQWHVAFTLGLGAGMKIYRGRMVRLSVDVDALQLAQGQQPQTTRATDADVRGLNWMQSGYRPWRLTLHHDLYRQKPDAGCAAPTRSTSSKTLFDPKKMKGAGKAKHKGFKKALKNRED